MAKAIIGHPPAVSAGQWFRGRRELVQAGVHRYTQDGIDFDGTSRLSVAIVLNGGYRDDKDLGDWILYTGKGGQDLATGIQVTPQRWEGGNAGLRLALLERTPVRVIRGPKGDGADLPRSGFRYDGLYYVTQTDYKPGVDGVPICQFVLERSPLSEADDTSIEGAPEGNSTPRRRTVRSSRVIRDSDVARYVKIRHRDRCQICGTAIEVPGATYSQASHIVPLGSPHDGPDTPDNVLCLCPNHHVMFDNGGLLIDDDLCVWSTTSKEALGSLRTRRGHEVSRDALRYHRNRIAAG